MKTIVLLTGIIGLNGCASIVDGSSQSISVKTTADGGDVAGAQCALTNNKGTWFVTTPGSVTVHRSYEAINVRCQHDGFIANELPAASSTKPMAFGNLLFGGLIGATVDVSTGAAYDYPNPVVIPLQPAKTAGADGPPTS